jgi:predicted short-subunit dehydrogenase-like oxidoreductase (DUF2520 family)
MPQSQSSKLSPAAVIGPGRVGMALAIFLDRIGVEVTVGARSELGRERAAAAGLAIADSTEATRGASLVLLTVPDDELPSLVTALAADGAFSAEQVVVHTAGVDGPGLLAPAAAVGARTAACHPVQIFNDDLEVTLGRLPGTVWGVTGDPAGREVVAALGGRPMDVPESGRVRYHAALVLAANGCAALSATATDQLRAGGVIDPAALLSGLIHASVDSALSTGQAGLTVAMHTEALARKQKVINVYVALARLVADRAAAAGRLDPEARARVEAGLHGHVEGEDSHERLEMLRRLGRRARGREQR